MPNEEPYEQMLVEANEPKEKESEIDALLYKVSHDIKGPLNSIMGLTNIALGEIEDEKAAFYFAKIKNSVERLQILVNDLLNVSKISVVGSENDRINFQETIDNILGSLQYLPNFKRVDISINIQQFVDFYSDATTIYSVFQNIIENSIKYSDTLKSFCYLKIKIHATEGITKIEFEDNGIGIDEESKDRVFDMFYRGTTTSTGNGIGLFIAKKSIEKLNGTINIKSKAGIGTTVILAFNH